MILGEDGEKMSKSRGNVVNPDDIVRELFTELVPESMRAEPMLRPTVGDLLHSIRKYFGSDSTDYGYGMKKDFAAFFKEFFDYKNDFRDIGSRDTGSRQDKELESCKVLVKMEPAYAAFVFNRKSGEGGKPESVLNKTIRWRLALNHMHAAATLRSILFDKMNSVFRDLCQVQDIKDFHVYDMSRVLSKVYEWGKTLQDRPELALDRRWQVFPEERHSPR